MVSSRRTNRSAASASSATPTRLSQTGHQHLTPMGERDARSDHLELFQCLTKLVMRPPDASVKGGLAMAQLNCSCRVGRTNRALLRPCAVREKLKAFHSSMEVA